MKFLVLGCNGMAGHLISLYLQESGGGNDVLGFARTKSRLVPSVTGDAENERDIADVIHSDDFDTIINCIGVLNRSAENNKARAVYLNSYLPHLLARLTEGTRTQVIHMSTDCVFSGKTGAYTEGSLRDGETFYDRTKALGELEDNKNLTLRNSIVGPDINPNGIGLLNWFMQQTSSVRGYTKAMWTGLTTLQLAKVMETAANERVHGLYNMVPEQNISKCELLELFNRHLRKGQIQIEPYDGVRIDKTLIRTRFDFPIQVPEYEQMVMEMADWMRRHADLYPHYLLN